MLRNPSSRIFRPKNPFLTEIWGFQKICYFRFSQKRDIFCFASCSAILRSIVLNDVSFERAEETEQDDHLFTSRTKHLDTQNFQKLKTENLGFGVFRKNCTVGNFAPQILLAYLVENFFLYKMHYRFYFWKPGKVLKNAKHRE